MYLGMEVNSVYMILVRPIKNEELIVQLLGKLSAFTKEQI